MRITFMGSSEFAVPTLKELAKSNHEICSVVTIPDVHSGRGLKVHPSPVKIAAQELGLEVIEARDLNDVFFTEKLKSLSSDLQVVVAFKILPKKIFSIPQLGSVNLHASLLPDYRGAAPINWALINGEKETGLTTFFIDEKVDTGNIILQKKKNISPEDNFASLYKNLMEMGPSLVLETIDLLEKEKNFVPSIQKKSLENKKAPKISRTTCEINFNHTAEQIKNLVRGLSPKPGAFFFHKNIEFKILQASIYKNFPKKLNPGEFFSDEKNILLAGTADGIISIEKIQQSGKKAMEIKSFLQGAKNFF